MFSTVIVYLIQSMRKRLSVLRLVPAIFAYMAVLASCALFTGEDDQWMEYEFDFLTGPTGWTGDFADYPAHIEKNEWDLETDHRGLPDPLESGGGLYISGINHSDDLFMFIKGSINGLPQNKTYRVRLEVDVATDAPSGCVGIGGAPGESVYMKAGASEIEPMPVVAEDGYYRMNVDKGNQAQPGEDARILGHIGNTNTDCNNPVYEIKTFEQDDDYLTVTSSSEDGIIWLFVGTDSGFEGRTSLYYTRLKVSLRPE